MTSILTFSVYSLRVSSDIPVQSEYLPIIGFYFIFAITFILIAFIWFIILNQFNEKKSIPRYMEIYGNRFRSIIESLSNIKLMKMKQNNLIGPDNDLGVITTVCGDELKSQDECEKDKCTKCDLCKGCLKEKHEEHQRFKDLEALTSNLTVLNLTAFFIIFISTLAINLFVWLSITIN